MVGDDNITLNINYTDILITKTIGNLPLEVTHDEDQLVEFDISTYTVELEGFVDDINAIKYNEMKNIICVKGLASGTHQMPLEIPYGFSQRVKVKSLNPSSIPITIRLLEKVEEVQNNNEQIISSNEKETIASTSSELINEKKSNISSYSEIIPQIIKSDEDSNNKEN